MCSILLRSAVPALDGSYTPAVAHQLLDGAGLRWMRQKKFNLSNDCERYAQMC